MNEKSTAENPAGGGIFLRLRRLLRARDGAMAVEFAFVGPIFIIILWSVFEFGRFYWIKSSLQYAVEDAGRYAMAHFTRNYWAYDAGTTSCPGASTPPTVTEMIQCAANDVETKAESNAVAQFFGWSLPDPTFDATQELGTPDLIMIEGTVTFEFIMPFVPTPEINLKARTRVPLVRFDT